MRREIIAVARVAGFAAVAAFATFAAVAQTQATGDAAQIKPTLLRPAGWLADWERPGEKGQSEMVFEARGENIVVKIKNLTLPTTCEHDVTIANGTVKFDGCYDADITLRFDAGDNKYPFKGGSPRGFGYMLHAKDAG